MSEGWMNNKWKKERLKLSVSLGWQSAKEVKYGRIWEIHIWILKN